jgi:serine phosphatase RsbU (regulator of sigma subunit)/pSer/pThr/pTyr-binding forkhead associated (FHA) protein
MPEPSSVALDISDDTGATQRLQVDGNRFVVGRLPELAVCLPADGVSRQHAEFMRDPSGRWWVRDLASRNGTRVNGKRLTECALAGGERIRIGPYILRFHSDAEIPSALTTMAGSMPVTSDEPGPLCSLAEIPAPQVRASHLSRLVQFGRELSEIEDSAARLRALCELMISGGFPGQWAVAVRLTEGSAPQPAMLLPPAYRQKHAPSSLPYLSSRLLSAVRQRRTPVMASNTGSRIADIEVSMAAAVQMHTAIACPIGGGDLALDILYMSLQPSGATSEWFAIVGLAAEQYQQSESLWSQRKLAAEHAVIQEELEQARKVQDQLVPHNVSIEGLDIAVQFHPCRWVAGDYVDVIRTDENRIVLVIADVCGHGMQAALLAQTLHAVLNVLIPAGQDLGDVVGNLNNYLCRTLKSNQFATALCIEFNLQSGKCRSLRAGHPAPLVIDRAGQWRELQCGPSLPLGLEEGKTLPLADDHLAPGETLALFTDGLFEILAADGKHLEQEGLTRKLASICSDGSQTSSQIAERLMNFVEGLQGDGFATDDQSLLILRRI